MGIKSDTSIKFFYINHIQEWEDKDCQLFCSPDMMQHPISKTTNPEFSRKNNKTFTNCENSNSISELAAKFRWVRYIPEQNCWKNNISCQSYASNSIPKSQLRI